MRTTLDIDEDLLEKARELAGTKTKTETVEEGLRELIDAGKREQLVNMRGSGYGLSREEFLESRVDE